MCVNCLAWVQFNADRLDEAESQYALAVECGRRELADYEVAHALNGLGNIAARRADTREAVRLWAAADEVVRSPNPLLLGEARVRADLS